MRFITIRFAKSVMSTVLQNRHPCEKARQIPVIELDAPLHLAPALIDYFAGKTRAAFVTTGSGAALPKARGHFVSPCATVKSALWCLETVLSGEADVRCLFVAVTDETDADLYRLFAVLGNLAQRRLIPVVLLRAPSAAALPSPASRRFAVTSRPGLFSETVFIAETVLGQPQYADLPLLAAPGRLAAYAESAGRYLHAITERMKRAKTAQSRRTVPA